MKRVGVIAVALAIAGGGSVLANDAFLGPASVAPVGRQSAGPITSVPTTLPSSEPSEVPVGSAPTPTPTSCEPLIEWKCMERLPDHVLTGDEHDGALGPIERVPDGILTFDKALVAASHEDGQDATAVEVTLGTADPVPHEWDTENDVFYRITWFNVCLIGAGPPAATPSSGLPPCWETNWATIIDARTGAFIVGGTSSP